jgi:hypothetical protein
MKAIICLLLVVLALALITAANAGQITISLGGLSPQLQ